MTKVEIDGKTYCVETLIYTVERLTKEVKASAEYHRLVLEQIRAEIKKEYEDHVGWCGDNDRYTLGLKKALDIYDKYAGDKE